MKAALHAREKQQSLVHVFRRVFGRIKPSKVSFYLLILLNVAQVYSICQRTNRTSSSICAESSGVDWLSRRSKIFTNLWTGHKVRNAATYVCVSTRHLPLLNYVVYHALSCPDVFYDAQYDKLFAVPLLCFSHRCLKRYGRSHYIYAEFVVRTYDAVTASNIMPSKPKLQGKVAVLLEPRHHPLLEYTTKQVMLTLGPEWALQIFVSSSNKNFVRERLRVYDNDTGRNIVLTTLENFGLDDMSRYGNKIQSAFSAHENLYHAVQSEHILWFQLDVVMRRTLNEDWLRYAYIGAEWKGCEYPTCSKRKCRGVCGGGNSGLSHVEDRTLRLPLEVHYRNTSGGSSPMEHRVLSGNDVD